MMTLTYKQGENLSIYLNGNFISTNKTTGYIHAPSHVRIGSDKSNANFFSGNIDEFGMWKHRLNDFQIQQLYNNGSGLSFYSNWSENDLIITQ